ncbi:MAG TPA: hypothetical protein VGM10_07435 [Actinocrinis sp.]|jgi:hypothetical protein
MITSNTPADPVARERQYLETVGSADWSGFEPVDEFRFSRPGGRLLSVALHVPETAATSGPTWMDAAVQTSPAGSLALVKAENFRIPAARVRHYDQESCALVGLYRDVPPRSAQGLRIAPDLSLLADAGKLSGWVLTRAPRHLAQWTDQHDTPGAGDAALADALADFLDLIEERHLDHLYDGEPWLAERLTAIKQRIPEEPGANATGRAALRARIDELMADWFSA